MQQRGGPEIQGIKASVEQTLEEIFGTYSTEYRRYSPAAVLSGGPVSLVTRQSHQDFRFRQHYDQSRQTSIALLQQAIQGLEERLIEIESNTLNLDETPPTNLASSLDRFL